LNIDTKPSRKMSSKSFTRATLALVCDPDAVPGVESPG
jgi:hypothetical protein